jgi:hypothetical protein
LASLAIVIDELEFGLARIIFSNNIPVFPEFWNPPNRAITIDDE